MPELRSMFFTMHSPLPSGGPLTVEYDVNRTAERSAQANSGGGGRGTGPGPTAKLTVEMHPVYEPDEEAVHAWREAAREHTGEQSQLVVVIGDSDEWKMRWQSEQDDDLTDLVD